MPDIVRVCGITIAFFPQLGRPADDLPCQSKRCSNRPQKKKKQSLERILSASCKLLYSTSLSMRCEIRFGWEDRRKPNKTLAIHRYHNEQICFQFLWRMRRSGKKVFSLTHNCCQSARPPSARSLRRPNGFNEQNVLSSLFRGHLPSFNSAAAATANADSLYTCPGWKGEPLNSAILARS